MILARASQIIDCILQRYHKTRKNALFSWQPLDIRAKERDLSQKKKTKKNGLLVMMKIKSIIITVMIIAILIIIT